MQIEGFPAFLIWFVTQVDWWLWKLFYFFILKVLDAPEHLWFIFWVLVGIDVLFRLLGWIMSRDES